MLKDFGITTLSFMKEMCMLFKILLISKINSQLLQTIEGSWSLTEIDGYEYGIFIIFINNILNCIFALR